MEIEVDHLTNLMSKLDLDMSSKEISMLDNMLGQMKITETDDNITKLIGHIKELNMDDNIITIKLDNKQIIFFRIYGCCINTQNTFIPTWCY